jgi:hypothetical protein
MSQIKSPKSAASNHESAVSSFPKQTNTAKVSKIDLVQEDPLLKILDSWGIQFQMR